MKNFTQRTEILIGKDKLERIKKVKVGIFGLGGVGTYVLEALARLGISKLLLVDKDKIDETNINRQILALRSTVGKSKVNVAKTRVLDINPDALVDIKEIFYTKNCIDLVDGCDFVVDAMDTITAKLDLVQECHTKNIKIVSCMGTAKRLDPTKFLVADIYNTSICPICRVMRRELKKRGIPNLKVLYSTEEPRNNCNSQDVLGSVSFVPSVAGLIIAETVYKMV